MLEQIFSLIINNPVLSAVWLFFVVGLIFTESQRGGKSLTTSEATKAINNDSALILDVRKKEDFRAGHLPNAINIPMDAVQNRMSELEKHKTSPIIIVCKTGTTAGGAGGMLRKAGFEDVRRLKGGILEWQAQNLPLVKK